MEKEIIEGFQLLRPLRRNSISTTWQAYQQSLSRTVVVKVLHRELSSDRDALEIIMATSKALAGIKHPNLIRIFDVVHRPPEPPYLIYEEVTSPSLADLIEQKGRIEPRLVAAMARDVASVMGEVWRRARIVHRNLKPGNLAVSAGGNTVIADMDSAIIADMSSAVQPVGTPNYMAPEQVAPGHSLDCRADMYSLGATMYHALTGSAPFAQSDPAMVMRHQKTSQIPHPRSLVPGLRLDLCQFVRRLMMKDPADRFADWQTVEKTAVGLASGKIMLSREQPAGGLSTVAEEAAAGAVSRSPLALITAGLVKTAMWLLLLAWLIILAWHRWHGLPLSDFLTGALPFLPGM